LELFSLKKLSFKWEVENNGHVHHLRESCLWMVLLEALEDPQFNTASLASGEEAICSELQHVSHKGKKKS
jgi:hypothetical protein